MKKQLLTYFFLFLLTCTYGQTIQELEYDLQVRRGSEENGGKIDKAKILQRLDPFNLIAARYICDYYTARKIDSVSIFFDNLATTFPKSAKPYLLRYDLLFIEHDYQERDNYNHQKLKLLTTGLAVENSSQEVLLAIAKTYYEDFIYPFEKRENWLGIIEDTTSIKESTFKHSADSALAYFYKVWIADKNKREIIYYPIRQLECYLNKLDESQIPKDAESDFEQCFFPSWYFGNLKKDWQCDKTIDYLFEIKMAKWTAEGLKSQLSDLKENCIYDADISTNKIIYRFTWLRSFHKPISIRIEKSDGGIMLYWKLGKGAGGYKPRGLKSSGKKKLKISEWTEFTNLVSAVGFDSLRNQEYVPMNDGATWTLERKTFNDFKAHDTNEPSKEFTNACLYLLKKTSIKVKKEDIY